MSWNLSAKIVNLSEVNMYREKDVQEFIRRLKEWGGCDCPRCKEWLEKIDKLAGSKLTGGKENG